MDRFYWKTCQTDITFNPIDNYFTKYKEFTEICQTIDSYDDTFFLQIASSAVQNIK